MAPENSELVLIAGMHRSGTSALARVFNLVGAHIPEPVVPPFRGNEHGHWEPEAVVHMNDRFLAQAGVGVNTSLPIAPLWFGSPAARRAAEEVAEYLRPELASHQRVVIKDPRIALLAPVWRRAVERLGARPRFVLPFRRPQEAAASLARRQLHFFPDEVWPTERAIMIWLTHVVELERATRGTLRSFIAFDALLTEWRPELERIGSQIDLPLTPSAAQGADISASLRGDARREVSREDDPLAPDVRRVLDALQACVADPLAQTAAFDAVSGRLDAMRALLGDYLGALEAKAQGCGDLQRLADAAGQARDAACERARRLELRESAAKQSVAVRASEAARLADVEASADGAGRGDRLRLAHALAEAQTQSARLELRVAALMDAHRDRAQDARRAGERLKRTRRAEVAQVEAARADLAQAQAELTEVQVKLACAELDRAHQAEVLAQANLQNTEVRERLAAQEVHAREQVDSVAAALGATQEHAAQLELQLADHVAALGRVDAARLVLIDALARADADIETKRRQAQVMETDLARAREHAASSARERLHAVAEAGRERDIERAGLLADRHAAHLEAQRQAEALTREVSTSAALRASLAALETRATALQAELESTRRTLSWKVTSPLRRMRAGLR